MPTDKVTVKLYPLEYTHLFEHLSKLEKNVKAQGLNASTGHLLLYDFFWRKGNQIARNAKSRKGQARSLSLKPHEARAIYEDLRIYSYNHVFLGAIFWHLDRAMVNLGFQNQQL